MPRKSVMKGALERIEEKQNLFIDRIEPQKIVDEEYDRIEDQLKTGGEKDFKILNFYGLGGLGKTELTKRLQRNLRGDDPKKAKPYITWDADQYNNVNYNLVEVLLAFRNLLVVNHSFKFTEFDHYLIQYKAVNGETAGLKDAEGNIKVDGIKGIGRVAFDMVVDTLGGINPLNFYEKANGYLKKNKESNLAKKISMEIGEITQQERMAVLKEKFKDDYNKEIKKRNRPLVIFIDTFEDFNLNSDWLFSGIDEGLFGFGLCQSLAGTLWVISGRDHISYAPSEETEDLEAFDFFLLNKFSREDTLYYWKKHANPREDEFSERIWEATEGHPLLLGIYYDFYTEKIKENPNLTLDEFFEEHVVEKENKALVQRYVRYLVNDRNTESDKSLGQLIRLLACIGTWSYEEEKVWPETLTKYIAGEKGDLFSLIYHKTIVYQLSDEDTERYSLDRTVKEILLTQSENNQPLISDFMKKDVFNYLVNKSKNTELPNEQIYQIIILSKNLHKANGEEFFRKASNGLEHVFEGLLKERRYTDYMSLLVYLLRECSVEYLNSESGNENVIAAIKLAEELYVFEIKYSLEELVSEVDLSTRLLSALGNYYFQEGNINRAEELLKQAISYLRKEDSDKLHFDIIRGLEFISSRKQNIELQIEYLKSLETLANVINEELYYIMYYSMVMNVYGELKHFKEAIELSQLVDKLWLNYPYINKYLLAYYQFCGNTGVVLSKAGFYEEALNKLELARKGFSGYSGEDDPNVWRVVNNIATVYQHMNQKEKAEEVYENLYFNRRRVFGINNFETIQSALNYSLVLIRRNKSDEAIVLLTDSIVAATNVLPKGHQLVGKLHLNLADHYNNNGQYQAAIDNYIIALNKKANNPIFEKYILIRDEIKLYQAAFNLVKETKDTQLAQNITESLQDLLQKIETASKYYKEVNELVIERFLMPYYQGVQTLLMNIEQFLNNYNNVIKGNASGKLTMNIIEFQLIRFSDGDRTLHMIYDIANRNKPYALAIDYYKDFVGTRSTESELSQEDLRQTLTLKNTKYYEQMLDYQIVEKFEGFDEIINRLSNFNLIHKGSQITTQELLSLLNQ